MYKKKGKTERKLSFLLRIKIYLNLFFVRVYILYEKTS